MDKAMIREHLAQSEGHIAQGEQHIRRQLEIIAQMKAEGHEAVAANANELLQRFEEMQAQHVAHRDRLLKELAEISN